MAVADWKWLREILAGVGAIIAAWGFTFMGSPSLMGWWIVIGSSMALAFSPHEQWRRYAIFAWRLAGGIGLTLLGGEWLDAWFNATSLPRTRIEYGIRCAAYMLVLLVVQFELNRQDRIANAHRGNAAKS